MFSVEHSSSLWYHWETYSQHHTSTSLHYPGVELEVWRHSPGPRLREFQVFVSANLRPGRTEHRWGSSTKWYYQQDSWRQCGNVTDGIGLLWQEWKPCRRMRCIWDRLKNRQFGWWFCIDIVSVYQYTSKWPMSRYCLFQSRWDFFCHHDDVFPLNDDVILMLETRRCVSFC